MNPTMVLILIMTSFGLAACSRPVEVNMLSGKAQGTTWHVSVWSKKPVNTVQLQADIETEFARIDKVMSNYRPDSVIEQFNDNGTSDAIDIGKEIVSLVDVARNISVASEGCYDLTVKPLFDLWGFNKDVFSAPSEKELEETRQSVGLAYLSAPTASSLQKNNPGLRVDLSSIAQGYSVARIVEIVEDAGITDYLVEIGGELQTRGHKPDGSFWRIAIEKPLPGGRDVNKIITIEQDSPVAVMTSGTYRHYFDEQGTRYSHILDARTGKPVNHATLSVTVVHNDPTEADAWSTALLCLGQDDAIRIADANNIAAFFISEQQNRLIEHASQAWLNMQKIRVE